MPGWGRGLAPALPTALPSAAPARGSASGTKSATQAASPPADPMHRLPWGPGVHRDRWEAGDSDTQGSGNCSTWRGVWPLPRPHSGPGKGSFLIKKKGLPAATDTGAHTHWGTEDSVPQWHLHAMVEGGRGGTSAPVGLLPPAQPPLPPPTPRCKGRGLTRGTCGRQPMARARGGRPPRRPSPACRPVSPLRSPPDSATPWALPQFPPLWRQGGLHVQSPEHLEVGQETPHAPFPTLGLPPRADGPGHRHSQPECVLSRTSPRPEEHPATGRQVGTVGNTQQHASSLEQAARRARPQGPRDSARSGVQELSPAVPPGLGPPQAETCFGGAQGEAPARSPEASGKGSAPSHPETSRVVS